MTQAVQPTRLTERSHAGASKRILRFGVFEVDLQARELRKSGMRLKLQQKPFRILEMLLERPGELVTRKEVAERLWPGIHVAFDRSLNTAVNGLRRALADSPRNPRYLETRSGLGYRFIAPVEKISQTLEPPSWGSIDSIAVLPFACASPDSATDELANEIAEQIIAALSTIDHLRIASRSAAFRYSRSDLDAAAIGRDLNVEAVLTGQAVRRGEELTISAELVDAGTGWRLWGAHFEGAAAAREIAAKLRLHLNPRPGPRGATLKAGAMEEPEDYLKGRYFQGKLTADALRQSVGYFESALAADPDCALAYAGLADTYQLFALLEITPAGDALSRARDAAQAAVRIDNNLGEAHTSLAGVKKLLEWDWRASESEYRRALELKPGCAMAHHCYAALLSSLGRSEEALEESRRALELDPLSLVVNNEVAWNLYIAREFEKAVLQAWKTLALEARFAPAQHTLGLANEQLGNTEEAIVEFRNACVCSGNHPAALAALAHAHAGSGQISEALKILRDIEKIAEYRHVSPYWLSMVHLALGDRETALELLARGLEQRDVWMIWLKVEPRFDPLRSDSRFESLLQGIFA